MARANLSATRLKPEVSSLLTLRVLRREPLSEHFARATLGDGDIERFTPMGFDQWFRLFIPVLSAQTLGRLPDKLTTLSYAKYLTIAKTERPVLRSYSVRATDPRAPNSTSTSSFTATPKTARSALRPPGRRTAPRATTSPSSMKASASPRRPR